MIFLRTTSKAFGNSKKGTTFRSDLQQSFQFGGHRGIISNSPFSYYINFTAGYTFAKEVSVTSDMPFWRMESSINYDKCAESLFAGIGLVEAHYSYDGSGDSGDFNEDDLNFSHAINMNKLLHSAGLLDSTDPNHCMHLRSPANRFFQNGILTQTRGGTRPACDSIEYTAYNALETQYGGWENNAGANGHVTILQGDEVSIEYNESYYTCERCDEEYDDHASCSCKKCPECFDYVDEDTDECECCGKKVHNCKGKGCSQTLLGEDELCRYCKKELAVDK